MDPLMTGWTGDCAGAKATEARNLTAERTDFFMERHLVSALSLATSLFGPIKGVPFWVLSRPLQAAYV